MHGETVLMMRKHQLDLSIEVWRAWISFWAVAAVGVVIFESIMLSCSATGIRADSLRSQPCNESVTLIRH